MRPGEEEQEDKGALQQQVVVALAISMMKYPTFFTVSTSGILSLLPQVMDAHDFVVAVLQ